VGATTPASAISEYEPEQHRTCLLDRHPKGQKRSASHQANQNLIFQTTNNRTTLTISRLYICAPPASFFATSPPRQETTRTEPAINNGLRRLRSSPPAHHGKKPPEQSQPSTMAAMARLGLSMKLCSSSAFLLLLLGCLLLPAALAEERFYEFVVSVLVNHCVAWRVRSRYSWF
jgi:hypothetical protein